MHTRPPVLWAILGLLLSAPLALATTVVQPTFERLVGSSDYIIRAVVKSVDSEWRNNPAKPGQRYIASKVTLDVREVIKGSPPNPLVLDLVGGRVGQDELTIEGAPKFVPGNESVLFVRGNGTNFYPLTGLMHGFFSVQRDAKTGREQVLRFDGQPVYGASDLDPAPSAPRNHTAQDRPLTPAAFRDQIQQRQDAILSREKLR